MRDPYPISSSSDKLQKFAKPKYPWELLQIGQSFPVPKNEAKLSALRTMASKKGKLLEMSFRVIEHDECFEVGRIA